MINYAAVLAVRVILGFLSSFYRSKMVLIVGLKNNEAIHHPWINKALEKAQKKVEARNYDVRKSLLKFDDVINNQPKVIFKQRNNILGNEINDLLEVYSEVNESVIEGIVQSGYYEDYIEDKVKEFHTRYGITLDKEDLAKFLNKQEALNYINDKIQEFFTEKEKYFNSTLQICGIRS